MRCLWCGEMFLPDEEVIERWGAFYHRDCYADAIEEAYWDNAEMGAEDA